MASAANMAAEAVKAVAEHGEGQGIDPLHQFAIQPIVPLKIGALDLSFTNSSLWMVITLIVLAVFLLGGGARLVPGRWQSMKEASYEFIANMVRETLGDAGRPYFPFIFALFMFIFGANTLSLIPYSFTVTSHIAVTFALAIFVFVLATAVGFIKHGTGYFRLFVPKGVAGWIMPLIVPIEVFSYFLRPITLSIRLAANMTAGHILFKIFGAFVIMLGVIGGWMPLAILVAVTALEFLVAFLQAFVFALLTTIYLNDALHMDH